ncbi:thiol reductant ABC exporter, CydC subunit [Micrococcales bacterium KH10]|nr:thiol reductant ABC exporter, CydC subunit [Micrococcales bacterium KH10]
MTSTAPRTRKELSIWLLQRTRGVLAPLTLSILMRIVGLVAGAALIGYAAHAAATALTIGTSLKTVVTVLVVIALGKAVARYLEQFFGHFVAFRALALLRTYFYRRLEPQAPAATEGRPTGDLLSRATRDIDRIEVFFAHTLGPALTAVIVPVGLVVWVGATTSWVLAAVAAVSWLIVGGIVPLLGGKAALRSAQRLRVSRGRIAQHTTDSIQGVREIVAFDYAERRRSELAELGEETHHDIAVLGRAVALRRGLNSAAMAASLGALVLVGAGLVSGGSLTVEELAMVIGLALGAMPAVTAVEEFTADLDQAFASAARVVAITETAAVTPQPTAPTTLASGERPGRVELSDVHFSYPSFTDEDERPRDPASPLEVLHGVSLTLEPGTVTALVGASGSGKSTIAQLVTRFYDPTAGTVFLDGVDLRDLDDDTFRSRVTIVGQRPYLFNASIADNLRFAAPEATEDELLRVCEQAALLETIHQLPDGLDTMVGEQGLSVSGGQRQRIAIARALLRNTDVLVLDEVTSQLDRDTESELTGTLRDLQQGRTTLIIAHRLSTVRDADAIAVVADGDIVARGTHDELMDRSDYYRSLVEQEQDAAAA